MNIRNILGHIYSTLQSVPRDAYHDDAAYVTNNLLTTIDKAQGNLKQNTTTDSTKGGACNRHLKVSSVWGRSGPNEDQFGSDHESGLHGIFKGSEPLLAPRDLVVSSGRVNKA